MSADAETLASPLDGGQSGSDLNNDVLRTDHPQTEDVHTTTSRPISLDTDDPLTPTPMTTSDVSVNGNIDPTNEAITKRKQPLMELAYSEESYVHRLRVAYELYMPAAYRTTPSADNNPLSMATTSTATGSGFEELASKLPPGGPTVPEDLVARWRILWGNWMQLYEWHTGFYEKLKALLDEDPDRIPKLFIDSRARLRSIYSKYCENQIKAAHIAEQHKDFFDEWRLHVGDKNDVISLLMQPVQRIMRYQLPIGEIVKWTERAKLPSLEQWQKALDIMKEIPKDTQLILEAARIDGFPGVITALGTLRIRGDLLVASLSHAELSEALHSYAKALHLLPTPPTSRNSGIFLHPKSNVTHASSIASSVSDSEGSPLVVDEYEEVSTVTVTAFEQGELKEEAELEEPVHQDEAEGGVGGGVAGGPDTPPPLPGGQKFIVSRLFLFDRMLLVTEEVKPKRGGGGGATSAADAFSQSTYQFRAAVNVNKMKFEPHWFMFPLSPPPDAVEYGRGAAGTGSGVGNADWSALQASLEMAADEDLRFALWDQTPGRDVVYIIDPQTVCIRSAWVVHLRDIQRMQQQLLMALEDPTKFGGMEKDWGSPPVPTTEVPPLRTQKSKDQTQPQPPQSACTAATISASHPRKWPSFSMRRPARLSSTSSATGASSSGGSRRKAKHAATSAVVHNAPVTPAAGDGGGSFPRSFSAERHRLVSPCATTPNFAVSANPTKQTVMRSASSPHRKCSTTTTTTTTVSDPRGFSLANVDSLDSGEVGGDDTCRNSAGFQKTKKVFSSLFFGKHNKKARSPQASSASGHPPLPPASSVTSHGQPNSSVSATNSHNPQPKSTKKDITSPQTPAALDVEDLDHGS